VQLQTQQEGKVSLPQLTAKIYKSDGFRGFYSGLTASLMRQLTYTTTRFAVYETAKKQMSSDTNFLQKMALAGVAGSIRKKY
jgi:dicarboxylate transporter 10